MKGIEVNWSKRECPRTVRPGNVCALMLGDSHRLRRRFMLMAVINAVFAPFIVLYLLMYSFFRYFEASHSSRSVCR